MTGAVSTYSSRYSLRRTGRGPELRRRSWPALLATLVGSLAFLIVGPGVGDMWAALARQSAARAGVRTDYWFAWFAGGTVPGGYSVLGPLVSLLLSVQVMAVLSTVALTPLVAVAVRGSFRPLAATWTASLVSMASLWSGRVAFAEGGVFAVLTVIAIRRDRPVLSGVLSGLAVLFSPIAGAFLLLGSAAAAVSTGQHRRAALVSAGAGLLALVVVAALFGQPGPEGFSESAVIAAIGLLAFMPVARPGHTVRVLLAAALVLVPFLAIVPNGMGSNLLRLISTVLPVAVVASSRARRILVALAVTPALGYAVGSAWKDLSIAAAPMSHLAYYTPLNAELRSIHGLDAYRVEVVPDGAHTAAYAVLSTAALAGGYETQTRNALDRVLI